MPSAAETRRSVYNEGGMRSRLLRVRRHPGWEERHERVGMRGNPTVDMRVAYTPTGDYIGDPGDARHLVERRGIAPELADPSHKTCSVGYVASRNTWAGWSHRAIHEFPTRREAVRFASEVSSARPRYTEVGADLLTQRLLSTPTRVDPERLTSELRTLSDIIDACQDTTAFDAYCAAFQALMWARQPDGYAAPSTMFETGAEARDMTPHRVVVRYGGEFDFIGLLRALRRLGQWGASRDVVVAPDDSECRFVSNFDGDGSDRLDFEEEAREAMTPRLLQRLARPEPVEELARHMRRIGYRYAGGAWAHRGGARVRVVPSGRALVVTARVGEQEVHRRTLLGNAKTIVTRAARGRL